MNWFHVAPGQSSVQVVKLFWAEKGKKSPDGITGLLSVTDDYKPVVLKSPISVHTNLNVFQLACRSGRIFMMYWALY